MDWKLKKKFYPHFDAPIEASEIRKLVSDPNRVANNSFYPFIRYTQEWQPFRKRPDRPDKKRRPIRYASRRDSYIFSYYRHLLSKLYEQRLISLGLDESVLAYRKIRRSDGRGKSNIDFSKDAFDKIIEMGDCTVFALDVSKFFESLDHAILYQRWAETLGKPELPADHRAIFQAVTRYAIVDRDDVYERLGYSAKKLINGSERLIYEVKFKDIPMKLCSNTDFKEKICGRGGFYKSLIKINRKPYGIPQGLPISDLLANLYMIDFDLEVQRWCHGQGGYYVRYSDDILIILPKINPVNIDEVINFTREQIGRAGRKLIIKNEKTSILTYQSVRGTQSFTHISGKQGKGGLEYLGFRFDGRDVFVRDATISRLYRKIAAGIKSEVASLIRRYDGSTPEILKNKFDYGSFFQRYGKVEDFKPGMDYRQWTFWTYARRASVVFGRLGRPIPKQLRHYKLVVRRRVVLEIERQLR